MPNVYVTSADVVLFNKVDMDLRLSEVLDSAPLTAALAARTTRSNTFTYNKKTANPSVGFRDVNDGAENTKSTNVLVTNTLKFLDLSFDIDEAAALVDDRGVDHIMGLEAIDHLQSGMAEIEEQVIYGTGNQASGFEGLANQSYLNNIADAQVVNAGGTTAGTGSSVWLIRTGEEDIQLIWGQQGVITIGDRQRVQKPGSSKGYYWALAHAIHGWCGVKLGTTYSAVRIANLTADSGKGLTDALISQAMEKFPASRGPTHIVMNRRSHGQLQRSRTATTPTGQPAPFPVDAFNVPIIVTDRISSTETLLT
jgi:hypothetical protein